MKPGWTKVALGAVCDVRKGTTITRAQVQDGDVPVVAGGTGAAYFHSAPNRAANLTTVSASGNAGYVNYWREPIFASDCITVEPVDPGTTDTRYIYWQLKQKESWIQQSLSKGAAQKHVYAQDLSEVQIVLPPLKEQQRIVAILDKSDELLIKRRAVITRLDSFTQAVFLDMFGDPVLNRRGLPVSELRELGQLDRGVSKHRPRNDPALLGGAYPLIQTGDVASSGGYITSYTATYSELGLKQSRLWPAGTLCITIAANIARTGILTFPACFPDSVVGFAADQATAEFVRHVLGFHQQRLEAQAPESAQKNINLKTLRGLTIPVPSDGELEAFSERTSQTSVLRRQAEVAHQLLVSTQASIAHRAFRGEL